ncbi:MAG: exosortase-associated EpsI family protein [Phycisphaerales bacterium]|nr:exosortase-associated EpsI family protein [Phycisphaerales bacterium]MCB9840299.1 exosortase-associated EpsI family protein [Phycisphaeraceae bacterium]
MLEDFEKPRGVDRWRRVRRRGGRRGASALLAPALTAVVLAGTLGVGWAARPVAPDTTAYFARVRDRVESVPYTLDAYIGTDAEVVAAARELLKPNAILQRRYVRVHVGEESWFDLIIVHCGDVRDMQGHYPPVCYPSSGWTIDAGEPVTVGGSDGTGVPAMAYVVSWPHDRTVGSKRIVNFFALPGTGAHYAREIGGLERAARHGATAQLGVAQIQILMPAELDPTARADLLDRVWTLVEPVIQEVVGGPHANG